jgi:hypothetical protein
LRADSPRTLLRSTTPPQSQQSKENYMNQSTRPQDPTTARPLTDEADIGSGEKTPAQKETEELIRQIPPLPPASTPGDAKPAPTN